MHIYSCCGSLHLLIWGLESAMITRLCFAIFERPIKKKRTLGASSATATGTVVGGASLPRGEPCGDSTGSLHTPHGPRKFTGWPTFQGATVEGIKLQMMPCNARGTSGRP